MTQIERKLCKNGLDRKHDNRQVPKVSMKIENSTDPTVKMNSQTILIVGSGRLAMHLNHWVSLQTTNQTLVHGSDLNKYKILNWDRHQDPHLIKNFIQQADLVWLAISDSAIVSFYEKYLHGFDLKVVHFSGALHDERILCAHPLMTFSEKIYSDDIYSKIQFAITGFKNLNEALPSFKNSYFQLSANDKPLYHALCVVAGNFPQLLWVEVSKICAEKNIPFSAFDIYLRQITENFISEGDLALTGPFARRDLVTIEKNKSALTAPLKNIYSQFQTEFLK